MASPVYSYQNISRTNKIISANTPYTIPDDGNSLKRSSFRFQNRSKAKIWIRHDGVNASADAGSIPILPNGSFERVGPGVPSSTFSLFSSQANANFAFTETFASLIGGLAVYPINLALADASGSITAANTPQQILSANANLSYLLIFNLSNAPLWVRFSSSGIAAKNTPGSFLLMPNGVLESATYCATKHAVTIIGSTVGQKFTCKYATSPAYPGATVTDYSGTIAAGGSAQNILPINSARKGYLLQNIDTRPLWFNDTGSDARPNTPGSYRIAPFHSLEFSPETTSLNSISLYGDFSSIKFSLGEYT